MTNIHSDVLKPYNLTIQQFNILRILRAQYPKVVNLKLIKERILDKMSDVSRLVGRLRERGFVERKTCSSDQRDIDIYIIEKGLNLLDELNEDIENISSFFPTLSTEEVTTLNTLLDKLRA